MAVDPAFDMRLVAASTRDLFEYLARLMAEGALDTRFSRPVGAVTYHVPCHLRARTSGSDRPTSCGRSPGLP
jgi:glycerol-3-phosphate dehydrogenase subunit C